MNRVVRFTIDCGEGQTLKVYFEPDGAEVVITDRGRLTVEISVGSGSPEPELTVGPGSISIWAWSGADTAVWDELGNSVDV
jgi:hypothetical protein